MIFLLCTSTLMHLFMLALWDCNCPTTSKGEEIWWDPIWSRGPEPTAGDAQEVCLGQSGGTWILVKEQLFSEVWKVEKKPCFAVWVGHSHTLNEADRLWFIFTLPHGHGRQWTPYFTGGAEVLDHEAKEGTAYATSSSHFNDRKWEMSQRSNTSHKWLSPEGSNLFFIDFDE